VSTKYDGGSGGRGGAPPRDGLPEIRHNEPNAQREPAVRERRQREAHARLHRRDPAGRLLGVRPRDPKRGLPVAPPPPHISKGSRGSGSRAFNIYIYIYYTFTATTTCK